MAPLGSTRLVIQGDGSVDEQRDYYPFGLRMPDRTDQAVTAEDYTGHELDDETGLHYAGARYYMSALGRWNGTDPLSDDFPAFSPYNYVENNPLTLTDPTGMAPDPPELGAGFSIRLQDSNAGWTFRADVSVGVSFNPGPIQSSVNVNASLYNGGLGTRSGSTGQTQLVGDLTASGALSYSGGTGGDLPVYTQSGLASTGLSDGSAQSVTLAKNVVRSTSGRNQTTGSLRLQGLGGAMSTYNDKSFLGGLIGGDGEDRYNTGGGSLTFNQGLGNVTVGTDVYTGEAPEGTDSNTVSNGYWLQTPSQQLLNNGRTYVSAFGSGPTTSALTTGSRQMWSQDSIHRLREDPLFRSTAVNQ